MLLRDSGNHNDMGGLFQDALSHQLYRCLAAARPSNLLCIALYLFTNGRPLESPHAAPNLN